MKAVTVRFHAQSRLTLALVLLVALALAFLPARSVLAAPDATASQGVATPTPAAAGHAGMNEAPTHAADTSHEAMPAAAKDDHALPVPTASAGHADEPAHAADTSHEAMPAAAKDDHALPAPTASAGHADEPAHESAAAHGDEDEAVPTATRGLVLGGFGAVNGLVIVGAAISKTRSGNKAKARRVSPPDTTTKGAAQ